MIILKTWACVCGYKQNFPQTQKNIDVHFAGWKLVPNQCPSCFKNELVELTGADLSKMTIMSSLSDEEIDNKKKTVVDENLVETEVPLTSEEKQAMILKRKEGGDKVANITFEVKANLTKPS